MNASQALYGFYSSFGIPAYDESCVPSGDNQPDLPYITFSYSEPEPCGTVSLSFDLWYKSHSWDSIAEKAADIASKLDNGGLVINYTGGVMWLKKGSPWAIRMGDPDDVKIKRYNFNLSVEFIGGKL